MSRNDGESPKYDSQSFPFLPEVIRWQDFYCQVLVAVWRRSFTDVLDKNHEMEINSHSIKLLRS